MVVKLNSGLDYGGVLAYLDGYVNITLEQTKDCVTGQPENKCGDRRIRGDKVLHVKHTEEKDVKASRVQHFSYLDVF